MTDWVRLWHDMPTDPKWRVIAKRSGAAISEVISTYAFVMINASANATERGRTHNLFADDIAAALDLEEDRVTAILASMQGKVMDGDRLTGWEKRQPKREDNSASRAKKWREDQKAERARTQPNATERPETETETDNSEANASVAAPSAVDLTKAVFDTGIKILMATGLPEKRARSMLGKWRSEYGDGPTIAILSRAEIVRPEVPIEWITRALQAERNRTNGQSAERFPQPTTLDAINRAIELTGGAEGRDAPRPASSDWGAGRLSDSMLALGDVER